MGQQRVHGLRGAQPTVERSVHDRYSALIDAWGDNLDVSAAHRCRDDDSGGVGGGSRQCRLGCGCARPKSANDGVGDDRFFDPCSIFRSFRAEHRPGAALRRLREGTRPRSPDESVSWAGGRWSLTTSGDLGGAGERGCNLVPIPATTATAVVPIIGARGRTQFNRPSVTASSGSGPGDAVRCDAGLMGRGSKGSAP
jgi:hypothetical protein